MKTFMFAVVLMPLLLTYSHPVNMICVPVCSPNISAKETLLNQWKSNDQSTGIDQLLNHKGTVIRGLMSLSSTDVSKVCVCMCACVCVCVHVRVSACTIPC